MDFARNMLEQIKLREQVKYQLIESNIIKIDEFKCEKTEIVNLTPQYKQIIESTNKYIQDIKRLQIKNNKYLLQVQQMSEINQTQRPPVLDSQKKVIKNFLQKPLKSSSNSLQIQDNNSDSLNFDIAAFLSSIILEANFHDITIEKIQKPELLNQKKERHQIKNDDNKIDDILHKKQDLYGENGIYPNLKNQFSANSTSTVMKSIDNQNKGQSLKKNILSFKIRKRLSRGGRFLIDKYFEDNEEIPIQKDLYYNTKPYQENYIIQQKLQKFQNISSFSDYDEEDFNETARIMKKNIQTGFKNFQKQRKAQVVVTN